MMNHWYDDMEADREPGWPKWFEYAKRENINEDPKRDPRPFVIQKWRRPLSEERKYSAFERAQLDLKKGQNLKTLLGDDHVGLL